jgi:hypothetical protein
MNFVIAVAMLMTPMIVRSIVGAGMHSMSSTLGPAAVAAMVDAPARAATAVATSREVLGNTHNFMRDKFSINKPNQTNRKDKT